MFANYVTSLIRTGAALLAGWLLTLPLIHPVLLLFGMDGASPAAREKLIGGLTAVLAGGWYALAHALEKRWPQLTVLLGSSQQPAVYASRSGPFTDGTGALPASESLNPSDAQQLGLSSKQAATFSGQYFPATADPGTLQPPVSPDPFMEGGGANPDGTAPAGDTSGGSAPSAMGTA